MFEWHRMLTAEQIQIASEKLFEAERSGKQTGLLSHTFSVMTLDDAYAVQAALVQHKLDAGARITGRKIGLTSKTMQRALNIETPDSGVLFDDMHFDNASTVSARRFIEPRIEAEIVFVMGKPLSGANVTREDVLAATESVVPSLEILDTRVLRVDPDTGRPRIIVDTVSDNAANAGLVLGDARHAIDAFDLRTVGAIVKRDGVVEETGLGAGVLDDPVISVVWLVQRLAQYGDGLVAGDVVLSGSFVRPIEAPPGSRFEADFGAFGSVSIDFAS